MNFMLTSLERVVSDDRYFLSKDIEQVYFDRGFCFKVKSKRYFVMRWIW